MYRKLEKTGRNREKAEKVPYKSDANDSEGNRFQRVELLVLRLGSREECVTNNRIEERRCLQI